MTAKEAQITINAIKFMLDNAQYSDDVEEALGMAIEALELVTINTESDEIKVTNCNDKDTIYRRDAHNAVRRNTFRLTLAEEQNGEGHVMWSAEAVYSDVMENELLELPSAQPDVIPLEWIAKHLEWLDNCDNDFAQLAKVGIRAMVEIWGKDTISRQAAIDEIASYERDSTAPINYRKIIEQLPSVQPSDEYDQGWKEGREALREETWEYGRDRLD